MKYYQPFLNNPLNDFCYLLTPRYFQGPQETLCSKLEVKLMDCFEAYGLRRAKEKCAELMYDFSECHASNFQINRALAIRAERMRQYREGKLKKPFEEYPYLESFLYCK